MAETLLQKAQRLGIKPAGQPVATSTAPAGETLLQKAQRLGIKPANPPALPVAKKPGVGQQIVQGVASPFLKAVTSVAGAANATAGLFGNKAAAAEADRISKEGIDYGALGKVKAIGAGFDVRKPLSQNVKPLLDAAGTGAEIASYAVGGGGAKEGIKQGLWAAVKTGAKQGAKEGLAVGATQGLGQGLQEIDTSKSVLDNTKDVALKTTVGAGAGLVGGAVVGGGAPVVSRGASKVVEPIQSRIMPTGEQAVARLEQGYNEVFNLTKSGVNRLEKSAKAGKDPSRFLAEKGIVPEITPDGKIMTEAARKNLTQDIEELDDILTEGLKQVNKKVKLDDVRNATLKEIDNQATRADGSVFERQQEVNKIFDTYKKIYGEEVPLDILNEIKRGQYRLTKVFDASKPAFAKDVNYKVASAARQTIEDSAEGLNVKGFNQYYGDHLDALGQLEKINGNTVKGGRLGKLLSKGAGQVVGGIAGSALPLPFGIGPVVGGYAGGKVMESVQSKALQNSIVSPAARKVLEKTPKNYAPVVEEFIDALGGKSVSQSAKYSEAFLAKSAPKNAQTIAYSNLPAYSAPKKFIPTQINAAGASESIKNFIKPTLPPLPKSNKGIVQKAIDRFNETPNKQGGFIKLPGAGSSKLNIPDKLPTDDLFTLRDFTDYVNGAYKPTPKEAVNLEIAARRIVENYGITSPEQSNKALSTKVGKVLDEKLSLKDRTLRDKTGKYAGSKPMFPKKK